MRRTVERAVWFNGGSNGVEPVGVPIEMLLSPDDVYKSVISHLEAVRGRKQKEGLKLTKSHQCRNKSVGIPCCKSSKNKENSDVHSIPLAD